MRVATDCRNATALRPNAGVRVCRAVAAMILTGQPPARTESGCAPSSNLPQSRRPAVTVAFAEHHSAKPVLVEKLDKPARQESRNAVAARRAWQSAIASQHIIILAGRSSELRRAWRCDAGLRAPIQPTTTGYRYTRWCAIAGARSERCLMTRSSATNAPHAAQRALMSD